MALSLNQAAQDVHPVWMIVQNVVLCRHVVIRLVEMQVLSLVVILLLQSEAAHSVRHAYTMERNAVLQRLAAIRFIKMEVVVAQSSVVIRLCKKQQALRVRFVPMMVLTVVFQSCVAQCYAAAASLRSQVIRHVPHASATVMNVAV